MSFNLNSKPNSEESKLLYKLGLTSSDELKWNIIVD
jgi:hypothetical protein